MNRGAIVKSEKRNRIRRTETSSDDHRNGTTAAAEAVAAIAPVIARNPHRNIPHVQINRNHRQTTAHLVRSKAMCHHPIEKVINGQHHHLEMRMVRI